MNRLLRARRQRLTHFPYARQPVDPKRYGDLRRAVVAPYLVLYRVRKRGLEPSECCTVLAT